jgi:hypothetical protein
MCLASVLSFVDCGLRRVALLALCDFKGRVATEWMTVQDSATLNSVSPKSDRMWQSSQHVRSQVISGASNPLSKRMLYSGFQSVVSTLNSQSAAHTGTSSDAGGSQAPPSQAGSVSLPGFAAWASMGARGRESNAAMAIPQQRPRREWKPAGLSLGGCHAAGILPTVMQSGDKGSWSASHTRETTKPRGHTWTTEASYETASSGSLTGSSGRPQGAVPLAYEGH